MVQMENLDQRINEKDNSQKQRPFFQPKHVLSDGGFFVFRFLKKKKKKTQDYNTRFLQMCMENLVTRITVFSPSLCSLQ